MDNASFIVSVLPKLNPQIKRRLLKTLKEKGVEEPTDLKYVKRGDLMPPLNLVQAEKLIENGKLQSKLAISDFLT